MADKDIEINGYKTSDERTSDVQKLTHNQFDMIN